MNFNEVLTKLNVEQLNLEPSPNDPKWESHWDNDNRVSISLHVDTINAINTSNPSTLQIQTESIESKSGKGLYTAKRIVLHKPPSRVMGRR